MPDATTPAVDPMLNPDPENNIYSQRDLEALGDMYIRHIDRMTREDLHSKSAIAAELAWRDAEIEKLQNIRGYFPSSADGQLLPLGTEVHVVRCLIKESSGYGRNGPSLDRHSPIVKCRVVGIGMLGERKRRASFLEAGSSVTFSANLDAVFVSEAAALSAASPTEKKG